MGKKILIFGITVLLTAGTLAAGTDSAPLSLQQALKLGRENNLTLRQQQQRIQQAEAALASRKTGYLPTVSVNAAYNYTSKVARFQVPFQIPGSPPIEIEAGVKNKYDLNADIRQPVFTGFRTRNQVKSAAARLEENRAQATVVRSRILLQIEKTYYAVQLNELQQRVLRASLKRAEDNLRMVKNLYEAAQTGRFDTLKVATRRLQLLTDLRKLDHRQKTLLTSLARLLNLDSVAAVDSFSAKDVPLTLESRETYRARALQFRPELSTVKYRIRAGEYQKNALQAALFPQVFARASYHYARPGVNFFKDEWMNYYDAGISLQWEIWNWGRTGKAVKQAAYGVHLLNIEQEKLLGDIRQEVEQAYENLLSQREQIRLTRQLIDQEKERYRMAREKYEQGVGTVFDLNEAETSLTAAELQLQQAVINWMTGLAEMRYATGRMGGSTNQ